MNAIHVITVRRTLLALFALGWAIAPTCRPPAEWKAARRG